MQFNSFPPTDRSAGFRSERLGHLVTRPGGGDPGARSTWFGRLCLPGQESATELILQGTGKAPFRSQLIGAGKVMDTVEDIRYALRRSLRRYPGKFRDVNPDDWHGDLISVIATDADTDTFELTFEWGRPPALRALAFDWAGGVPHDLRLY